MLPIAFVSLSHSLRPNHRRPYSLIGEKFLLENYTVGSVKVCDEENCKAKGFPHEENKFYILN